MTSLIERLRAAGQTEAATALEQARELLMKASPTMHWKWLKDYDAWLRLIDGEQQKEG